MNKPTSPSSQAEEQRDALAQSEKKATEEQPQNFKDRSTAEKIVEIPPVDKRDDPIKGLDPK